MKTLRTMGMVLVLAVVAATAGFAQSEPDLAVQQAREETSVVFDLGRVFGFIKSMEEAEPTLRLTASQVQDLYAIMSAIRGSERIEPDQADDWLVTIEDDILTVAQLMYVDGLYLARASTSRSGAGTGSAAGGTGGESGGGSASGAIAVYLAGGKFNPILDTTRSMGQDFAAYYEELGGRR